MDLLAPPVGEGQDALPDGPGEADDHRAEKGHIKAPSRRERGAHQGADESSPHGGAPPGTYVHMMIARMAYSVREHGYSYAPIGKEKKKRNVCMSMRI